MGKLLIKCALVGGIVVYLWMILFYCCLSMSAEMMRGFANQAEVEECIDKNAPNDGIYIISMATGGLKDSPFIFFNIRRGARENLPKAFIGGLFTQIVGAGLIAYLILKCKKMPYWNCVFCVAIFGLIVAVLGILPAWNFWHFPLGFTSLELLNMVVSWFLAGLIISRWVKKY